MAIGEQCKDRLLGNRDLSKSHYLLIFLVVAFALRLGRFLILPSIYFPDEIFQTQEVAHRLAYGYGVITWDQRFGLRSWVLPAIISGVMKATRWLAPGSAGYTLGVAIFFSLLSLLPVWFAFSWCRRYLGMQFAFLSAFAITIWFELVNFGARAFSEFIAGNLLLPAIYLGSWKSGEKPDNRWRLFVAGLLLGLAVSFRVQFAPAVLLAGLWIVGKDWKRRILPVALGSLGVLAIFGIVDSFTLGFPFYSYYALFTENIVHHKAANFGVLPWYYFFATLFVHAGPLPLLALIGVRRSPILGWLALAVLLPHSMISHKEFRYIYPVIPLMITLASIGLLDLFHVLDEKMRWQLSANAKLASAAGLILACSLVLAMQFPKWDKDRGNLLAFGKISKDYAACGVAIVNIHWWDTGGYTYLNKQIPIFYFTDSANANSESQAFNRIVAPQTNLESFKNFSVAECQDGVCTLQREGLCQPGAGEFEINAYLKSRGD